MRSFRFLGLGLAALTLGPILGGCPAATTDDGIGGSSASTSASGANGSQGLPGPQGETGAAGPQGPVGPAGPVDATPPAAPTSLWIANSPDALPPNFELRWRSGDSAVPIQYFKVYESIADINSASDTLLREVVPGPSSRAVLQIFSGSGVRHFRVAAVSYTGVEGPLSPEFAVDTSARVAFSSDRAIDGQFNLYVGAPGRAPTPVSGAFTNGGGITEHVWSPTAREIAFVADADTLGVPELYIAPTDGSAARRKVSGPLVAGGQLRNYGVVWSPDATRLTYLADQETDEVFELYIARADNASPPVKVSGPLVAGGDVDSTVAWSPDGTHVAFIADKELDGAESIYTVIADGSAPPIRVSGPPAVNVELVPPINYWSPDSMHILFAAYDTNTMEQEVLVADANGSGSVSLTGVFASSSGARALWSPDGTRVAFIADYDTPGVTELFVAPADGSAAPIKLSGALVPGGAVTPFGVFYPWSPDGTRVMFAADRLVDNMTQLFVADAGGGAEPLLISDPALSGITSAFWSPDAGHVAYYAGTQAIRITDAKSSDSSNVVGNFVAGGALWGPCCYEWNAYGTAMYYMADRTVDERLEVYLAALDNNGSPPVASGESPPATADSFSGSDDASPIGYRTR